MRNKWLAICLAVAGASALHIGAARADILERTDHRLFAGKVISQDDKDVVFRIDGEPATIATRFTRAEIARIIPTDEHGGAISSATQAAPHFDIPIEPDAPPIDAKQAGTPAHPTYYVIPLHGEVGDTVIASALEKSLKDAEARKPSVVVLDINSPGGLVVEAQDVLKVLHHYNKSLRIVALTDQDLSAAAILSLSVREIYVKSTSTIGAAVPYVPGTLNLPPKLDEKMSSAWRAVARNSAEEGGHEPLLAEAMVDNDIELHLETVNGKPIVKEGPGDHELCRKGKILTLSSHEAVECGLAAGMADDIDELGKDLHMSGWTECKGLGTALADYLPKRAAALKSQTEMLQAKLQGDIDRAARDDASRTLVTVIGGGGPMIPQPRYYRPGMPQRVYTRPPTMGHTTIITHTSPGNVLGCVLALQDAEQDLKDGMSLYKAYGEDGQAAALADVLSQLVAFRAQIYDARPRISPVSAVRPSTPPTPPRLPAPPVPQLPGTVGAQLRLPQHTIKTDLIGGREGSEFTHVGTSSKPVTGFRFFTGHWNGKSVLRYLDPTWTIPPNQPERSSHAVYARDGYVVGGLMVDADETNTVAVQVIFVRYKDGHVDPTDNYKSDWIGTPDDHEPRQLAGKGETVIGDYGHRGVDLNSVGLVLLSVDSISVPATQEASGSAPANASNNAPETPEHVAQSASPAAPSNSISPAGNFSPDRAVKTELIGGQGGGEYTHSSDTGQPVIGFHFTMGDWGGKDVMRSLDPLYDAPAHHRELTSTKILARDGYVVGGLMVDADETSALAVQVIFVRYKDGHVDPTDTYKSDWIGTPDNNPPKQLAGKGETVIGVYEHKGMNLDAVGLVVMPAEQKAK